MDVRRVVPVNAGVSGYPFEGDSGLWVRVEYSACIVMEIFHLVVVRAGFPSLNGLYGYGAVRE